MTTKELKKKRFDPEFRALVAETVHEILAEDPDIGMELTPYAKKRLRAAKKNLSRKGISLAEARNRYY